VLFGYKTKWAVLKYRLQALSADTLQVGKSNFAAKNEKNRTNVNDYQWNNVTFAVELHAIN
jgi:hypothetical protein